MHRSRALTTSLFLGFLTLAACQPAGPEPTASAPTATEPEPLRTAGPSYIEADVLSPDEVDPRACAAGVNTLAFNLWRAIEDLPANAAISPTSIALAMSMVLAGARGDTAEELAHALGVTPDDEVHRCWAGLLTRWEGVNESGGVDLAIANHLFGQEGLPFEEDYLDLTARLYRSRLTGMNLRGQPEESRQAINQWVEETTRGRIKELLPPRSIGDDSTLILVNAIYLLATWEHAFLEHRTLSETFHRADGSTRSARMMHQTERFPYAAAEGIQILELPYSAGDLSMLVLLPETIDGLPALEARLDPSLLASWRSSLHSTTVDVALPRFTIEETSVELVAAFRALGADRLFGDAELEGILGAEPALISGIHHKTFVKVDEAGTEAAAATAVMAVLGLPSLQPPQFRADRPFLFLIIDAPTDTILLLGRVQDPE